MLQLSNQAIHFSKKRSRILRIPFNFLESLEPCGPLPKDRKETKIIMLTFILVFILFVLCLAYLLTKKDPLLALPSPQGLPWVGNAFQVPSSAPHQKFFQWAEEFGAVFIFRAFGKSHLVVNSVEGLREVNLLFILLSI